MEWTRFWENDEGQWQSLYNNSTFFKVLFPNAEYANYKARFWNDFYEIRKKTYSGSQGIADLFLNNSEDYGFTQNDHNVDFTEFDGTGYKAICFRDAINTENYLTGIFADVGLNKIVLHCGYSKAGVEFASFQSDISNITFSVRNLVVNQHDANDSFGNDYIVQPLYVYGRVTPFYTICGNTELAPFTLIQVQTRKFLVVGKGICVEVE